MTIPGRDAGANPLLFTPESDELALRGVTGHGDYSTASQTLQAEMALQCTL